MANQEEVKNLLDEKRKMEESSGQMQPTPAQKKFLETQIPLFNKKVLDMMEAHAKALEMGTTIREFCTTIVAGENGHGGLWFAAKPDLIVRQDTSAAQQMVSVCWPQKEESK